MSGIQLGSGQITVFAVIPKLVLPCCHRLVRRPVKDMWMEEGGHRHLKLLMQRVRSCLALTGRAGSPSNWWEPRGILHPFGYVTP
jgi:hypothetical protein